MRTIRHLLTFLFLIAQNGIVCAGDSDSIRFPEKSWDGQLLYYLQKGPLYLDKNTVFDLPDFPPNSSQETRDELLLINEYARTQRTKEQVEKIHIEASPGDFSEIYIDYGPFDDALKKSVRYLLSLTNKEIMYFILREKRHFSRPRPSQLDENLELLIPNPGHPAYPSGHATQSMLFSEILSILEPDNRRTYIEYAQNIAKRREIAGVHYPSDSEAGRLLAQQLLSELIKIPDFSLALEKAKDNYSAIKLKQ